MNKILFDVFHYKMFDDRIHIGTVTAGEECPGTRIGYIVMHETEGASIVWLPCHPTAFITYAHLQFLLAKLKRLNEEAQIAKEEND